MLYWLDTLGYIIATWVMLWSCLKAFEADVQTGFLRVWLQLISYYARYYMLWLIIWSSVQLYDDPKPFEWLMFALASLYLYMIAVEPNLFSIKRQTIELSSSQFSLSKPVKLAVVSDIHVGIFWGRSYQIRRLVQKLNQQEADAVIITGDWLYHAGADIIGKLQLFKALNKPCYTVLSEQDLFYENQPKNALNKLSNALSVLDIELIDDKNISIGDINIIGAGAKSAIPFAQLLKSEKPTIIVTHDIKQIEANPSDLSASTAKKLIIAGQTHGGQVNIPLVTPKMVQAIIGTQSKSGLSVRQPNRRLSYQVWTSTGVGMTGLPFRLNCLPSIDVLTIV